MKGEDEVKFNLRDKLKREHGTRMACHLRNLTSEVTSMTISLSALSAVPESLLVLQGRRLEQTHRACPSPGQNQRALSHPNEHAVMEGRLS